MASEGMNLYLKKLMKLTLDTFEGEDVKIILFGSRARRDNHTTSDADIGLMPLRKLNKKKVILLKERVEQLNIPYKVDIVDLSESSEDFRNEAMKGAVVWKDWN